MAVQGPAAALEGKFLLVQRGAEFDEVLSLATVPGFAELVCLITTADGTGWQWALLRPVVGSYVEVLGVDVQRAEPAGIVANSVNWICVPPTALDKWDPTLPVLLALLQEAKTVAAALGQQGVAGNLIMIGGPLAGPMPALPLLLPQALGGQLAQGLQAQQGANGMMAVNAVALQARVGAAVPGTAEALGFGVGPGTQPLSMDELAKAVEEVKKEISERRKSHKKKKDKKDSGSSGSEDKDKKRKKDKKTKRKKKKKKKRGASSGSSSSTDSSRSSSCSFLRWKYKGKNRTVQPEEVRKLETQKFKARGDFLTFAAKNPGALSVYFLAMSIKSSPTAGSPAPRC
ncbi:unnamed protein product [Polarella glacialis]|uniref:Uncharacterized protein n=1 Tax=Polarella glacialis TaxID=89957 RepID=A0A813FY26_POLGL|nr:unnamed protein product [Polarella glacialis]